MMKFASIALLPLDQRSRGRFVVTIGSLVLSLLAGSSLEAQANNAHKAPDSKPNVAAASLSSYLERVRAENSNIHSPTRQVRISVSETVFSPTKP